MYSHTKLQSVLEDSDRAIAFVKDLFGDDPKVQYHNALLNMYQILSLL